jgi:hypothetical protein
MDPARFDRLTLAFAEEGSRRSLIRRIAGVGVAALAAAVGSQLAGVEEAEARRCATCRDLMGRRASR